ncbi:hypothetical protein GF325_03325 [Candidatus Bathyarchaeota archaeon]|nr:hypothetical protein [Candidatus Bathyarchaeota archaeon]
MSGIGTGSFMYNLAGSFGPVEFFFGDDSPGARWGSEIASAHEERFLRSAASHVHQHLMDTRVKTTQTLANEDAWHGTTGRFPLNHGYFYSFQW